MKNQSKPSLPLRIKAALAAVLLTILIGGVLFYRAQERQQSQQVEENLTSIAQLKAGQIADWRREQLDDAAVLMERTVLIADANQLLAGSQPRATEETLRRFRSMMKREQYQDILLVDLDGQVRLSVSGRTRRHAGATEALAAALRDRKSVLTELHTEKGDPTIHISVVAPLFTGDGAAQQAFGAILLVSDAREFLFPLIQSWPVSSRTAETLLVRRDGDQVLFLNGLRHQPGAALKLRIPLSRTDVPAVMAVLGRQGVVYGRDYRGVEVIAAILPIPDSPWFIVSKMDEEEAFAAWRFRSRLILALIAFLIMTTAASGFAFRQQERKKYYRALFKSEAERFRVILRSIGDAVISTDAKGRVEMLNPVAASLTGWKDRDANGRTLEEVFRIVNEETGAPVESPVNKVLREGIVVGLANHTVLIDRSGTARPIADSGAPIRDDSGVITGVVLVFRDQTAERFENRKAAIRLSLIEYAVTHSMDELMTRALDEIGEFVCSPIGFYHFVESDQNTLSLQQWSTRTLQEFCRAEGKGLHYPIEQAGIWADCAREKKPIIHNDYKSLKHKKGMPEGHAEIIRELVVPVMRQDKVVAILGVGNKPTDYTDKDMETVSYLADVIWQIVSHKRADEAGRDSEKRYRRLFESAKDGILIIDAGTEKIIDINPFLLQLLGYSHDVLMGKHLWEIGPFKDIAASRDAFKILKDREYVRYEDLPLETGDGRIVQVEFVSNVYLVDHTQIIQCNIRDITERKLAEEHLRQSELRLRRFYESGLIGVIYWNMDGRIMDANDKFLEMVGYTRDDLVSGRIDWQSMTPPELRYLDDRSVAELKETGVNKTPFEKEYIRKDGTRVPIVLAGAMLDEARFNGLAFVLDITERKLAEDEVLRAGREWQTTFDATNDAMWILDHDQRILRGNKAAEKLFQRPQAGLLNKYCWEIAHGTEEPIPECPLLRVRDSLRRETMELRIDEKWFQVTVDPILDAAGAYAGAVHIISDITDRKRAETEREKLQAQLLQAQKMESVGRLAGGAAHDFNNMLNVIVGYTELALGKIATGDPIYEDLGEVLTAARRSADIIYKLLAFARKQPISPEVIDMNETVETMLKMLRRMIGEDIDLVWKPGSGLWPVRMDPSQVDQILANLLVNARDAITGPGRLIIETDNVILDDTYCAVHAEFVPGDYVMLAVSDEGCGMDSETLANIFEPFFTTKDVGKGTGLGLAMVYGIVKQNDGFINVYSEPGQGATFRIYLPRQAGETDRSAAPEAVENPRGHGEVVLVVEDEAANLRLTSKILVGLGYNVVAASSPAMALNLADEHQRRIDLLITDMIMPEMNGRDLAERLMLLHADLKVLFMSGYTAEILARQGVPDKEVHFIQKPFSKKDLAMKVREALME